MENDKLTKIDNNKIVDIITKMEHLTEGDKHDLLLRIASDDIEIRRNTLERITQSQLAQHDLIVIMGELTALNKQGMYVKSKQTIKTGSGTFEIEMKGGDTKLIIPVLTIIGIVVIAVMIIMFWK